MKTKTLISTLLIAASFSTFAQDSLPTFKQAHGGSVAKAENPGGSRLVENFTIAPTAILSTAGLSGESTFGAGLDAGVGINKFVSIHGAAYAYETDHWRGGSVDEAELYGRANFVRFADESFVFYGKGGLNYEFGLEEFGIGVGVGGEIRFTKNISVGADYTIFAHFDDREKAGKLRGFLCGTW